MHLPQNPETGCRSSCPICGGDGEQLLELAFDKKIDLPATVQIFVCKVDNFAYLTDIRQSEYDAYYRSVVNDYRHDDTQSSEDSPIIRQMSNIMTVLPGVFSTDMRVLDFGCGKADLLKLLAKQYPESHFVGYDPNPATTKIATKDSAGEPSNLQIVSGVLELEHASFDLIIMSHVLEHLVSFSVLKEISKLLSKNGHLYVEVPDAMQYTVFPRRSFLYYFDRLHVNHFSPNALQALLTQYGYGLVGHSKYKFLYSDGLNYPALSMVFRINAKSPVVESPAIMLELQDYLFQQRTEARQLAAVLNRYGGVFVWGCGDNFFRAMTNGGPLSYVANMILLDKNKRSVHVEGKDYVVIDPLIGIRQFDFPVAITVSESALQIQRQIVDIDPDRRFFFI